jgi:uncharacterized protein (TIGR02265 family)
MASVKGSVLRSRLDFVRSHFGEAGVTSVLTALGENDRRILTAGLLPAQWYDFDLGQRLDQAIMRTVGKGSAETFRSLGKTSAEVNLGGVHQAFVRPGDPHGLLRRAPAIYKLYYDTGRRSYEQTGPTSCRIVTHASESFSEADCLTVVGWHEYAVEMCGGRDVRIEHPACRARGDQVCDYRISWTSDEPAAQA